MRERLAMVRNQVARALLRGGIWTAGQVLERDFERRITGYRRAQERLRVRYRIEPDTPIRPYGPEVEAAISSFAAGDRQVRWAATSGSTARPKRIAFTRRRLLTIKMGSFSVAARLMLRRRIPRPSLFILAGLGDDDSLTSLLLRDRTRVPGFAGGLLMPAKYLAHPAVAEVVASHGATAARLWLLALTDPGIIYSTNPSTLAVFLTEVHERWADSTALVRDHLAAPERFPGLAEVIRRAGAPGWRQRFAALAASPAPLPVAAWLPSLAVYCSWDGGYVRPFLDTVRRYLPPDRFAFVPMYSMSTETVETLNHFDGDQVRFLPVAPGVLYEFLPEGAADDPALLLPPWQLQPGQAYAMVVSDAYGLRRYQTEDLFRCAARVGDAPDLHFLRRRGLAYSFTGEKLTDQHLDEVFTRLRAELPALGDAGVQLTCIPSRPRGDGLPFYRLVLAHPGRAPVAAAVHAAAGVFDRHLAEINREFAAKIESGRLGPTRAVAMPYDRLAAALDPQSRAAGAARRTWDSQFKLLPLYTRTWEDHGLDGR